MLFATTFPFSTPVLMIEQLSQNETIPPVLFWD